VQISIDDYVAFVDVTLDGYREALARLDDQSVNARPELDDANSAFAIVTHSTAACRWWLLHIIAGQPTDRVRADEFDASGRVAELSALVDALDRDLHAATEDLGRAQVLANDPGWAPEHLEWTVGTVAMHAYEELTQHLGHLELTVDLVT